MNKDTPAMQTHDDELLFSRQFSPTVPLSQEIEARSRKNLASILQKLGSTGQCKLAEALGVHESTVSRLKDGEFERWAKALAILGLQIAPSDQKLYPQEQIDAFFVLIRARMNSAGNADEFLLGN